MGTISELSKKTVLFPQARAVPSRSRLLLWATLLSLAAGSAHAADVPGNRTTQAKLSFGAEPNLGVWEKDGDRDWYRVTLAEGRTYAFGLDKGAERFQIFLRNAEGRVVAGEGFGNAGNNDIGLEFTARRGGTYFVEAVALVDAAGPVFPYELLATIDCAASRATDCTIRPGQTRRRLLAWFGDVDWFKTTLRAGQRYRVALVGSEAPEVAILDAKGQELVADSSGDGSALIRRFVPRTSGTYFIRARNLADQEGDSYSLTLNQP